MLAFLSALLMLASSERVLGRLVHGAAARTTVLLGLTLLSSVAFYPAMYLGAALGNSRPIVYAQPGHRLLSRDAIIAQQDLIQTTLGKALGMIYCRKALGEGDKVELAGLGSLFVLIMAAQASHLMAPLEMCLRVAALAVDVLAMNVLAMAAQASHLMAPLEIVLAVDVLAIDVLAMAAQVWHR